MNNIEQKTKNKFRLKSIQAIIFHRTVLSISILLMMMTNTNVIRQAVSDVRIVSNSPRFSSTNTTSNYDGVLEESSIFGYGPNRSIYPNISSGIKMPSSEILNKSYYNFGQPSHSSDESLLNKNDLTPKTFKIQSVNFTDQYQNRAIAKWSLQKINGGMKQINDPWVQDTLHNFTADLNAQARQQSLYAVVVINNPAINAFAIPGGVIGINAGTVMSAHSLDEVASVMAHEVAHISQRHYEHRQDNKTKSMLIQAAGILAATIAASASEGDAATAIFAGTSSAMMESQMAFSRANEREADRIGMQIMAQAGYDVHAMPKFFATLSNNSKLNQSNYSFIPSYVRTHPMSDERMSEASSRANQYPQATLKNRQIKQRHERTFDLLKWRLKVLSNQVSESELKAASRVNVGAKIALAHWYGKKQRIQQSLKLLSEVRQQLKKQNSNHMDAQILLAITESELWVEQNNYQKAIDLLTPLQKVYPERRDLRLFLASTLIESNTLMNAKQAIGILQPMSKINNELSSDRQVWQGLQLANEVLARKSSAQKYRNIAVINALRYRSYDQMWNSRYDKALISLAQAKQEAQKNNSTAKKSLLAMINQEIDMVKKAKNFKT